MFEKHRRLTIVIAVVLSIVIEDVSGKPPSKIIGGSDASIRDYPSLVSVRVGGQYNCGGTLITKKHVLTAAHCVLQYDKFQARYTSKVSEPSMDVFAGIQHKSESPRSHRYSVDKIDVHPDYNGFLVSEGKNDIAIITLAEPVETSDTVRPISLPTKDTPQGAVGYTVGWGAINAKGRKTDDLHQLKMTINDNITARCRKSPLYLCGARAHGAGICSGDSGSPLIIDEEVVGIASYSHGCGSRSPDKFTRVYHYLTWINGIINN